MNQQLIDTIVHAVLYEGYVPHPYRASAGGKQQPFTFGRVYPEAYHDTQGGAVPYAIQTECLIEGPASTRLEIIPRFLQPMSRDIGQVAAPLREMPAANNPDFFHVVPELEIDGKFYPSWQEAVERAIEVPSLSLGELCAQARNIPFNFVATRSLEPILDANEHIAGVIVRGQEAIEGALEISATPVDANLVKVTVRVVNRSPVPPGALDDADEIIMRTFASTHTLLHTRGGEFVSLIDPPAVYAQAAAACCNIGTGPVLVGEKEKAERNTMISSPVPLGDYPEVGPLDLDEMKSGLLACNLGHRFDLNRAAADESAPDFDSFPLLTEEDQPGKVSIAHFASSGHVESSFSP
jgi:hypothetical protein